MPESSTELAPASSPEPLPEPAAEAVASTFETRVRAALERIRPAVQFDGGDLDLVEAVEETGSVRIVMQGACVGCGMTQVTLQLGIERTLKELVPDVREVVAV